ncbi:carbamoyl-phosphate synthase small chain [Candidatus Blochmanniella vafra str. BVAF]|uniref:Carbamoyl phosphate synthase small chain n=1 Tax=Blochmanniella vafra (strain BVAF) TaxID=859654 RepID=E8Q5N3_BLOVB|nr:glutamine-hydrolyzing carbamoyl-phosphate synthase small subunit [Candidatus Blochmannia vafer]ADV33530.1 carbamoyl-phosphate synthase small chain [Candidatus Blochmannia vafer str. BVAF]
MRIALLVLEDGSRFYGQSIGVHGESVGEIVFSTSITGYQEIITDPSYARQIVVFTYPHIGNVGINKFDNESARIQVAGLVIRNLTIISSNFRSVLSLSDYLIQHNIVGISNIDTRQLTRLIRKKGIQRACITTFDRLDMQLAVRKTCEYSIDCQSNLAYEVSTSHKYIWNQGTNYSSMQCKHDTSVIFSRKFFYNVVVYDFGIKYNIMRILVDYGCLLTVVPANTQAQEVIDMDPDGIFLSNGPGNPNEYIEIVSVIKIFLLKTNIPIFGICLGHQLLALALGAKIIKMKFGHHGSNHPVKDLEINKVLITTQNHNFVVDMMTLPNIFQVTHISLFDGTLQGIKCLNKPVFGFQGHPEASPGPHDSVFIFNYFIELIKNYLSYNSARE